MSTIATRADREHTARSAAASRTEQLMRAWPLVNAYLWLSIVYLVEAWKHVTPWLFTDELEFTQLSRSIAATGHAARRGEPHGIGSLYNVMTAPFWLIQNTQTAYDAIKYFDVLLMASVLFPTYALARLVVGRRWALFAGVAAAATPALAYSSWIVYEPLAYPYAALCFFVLAKAFVARSSRRWWTAAGAVSVIAPSVRGELVVIPLTLALTALFVWWSSDRERARRKRWSWADHLGVFTLVLGASFAISAFVGHHSSEWYAVTTYYKHRFFVMGDWALGSLAIGLGIVPLALGLAAVFVARGETASREVRMFRCVSIAGLLGFGFYTAMKAAYLSTVFATRTEERNLIYVAPLLFVGTALVLERRRVNIWALAGASAYTLYLVTGTPFRMDVQLYSDALGTAIFQQANRYFGNPWTPGFAQWVAIAFLLLGIAAAAGVTRFRHRERPAALAAAALALLIVGWNLTGEIAAASGADSISSTIVPTLGKPFRWVDKATHGKRTLYLGQGVLDQNPEWLLEFWNRSIATVSSFDASLKGPGPSGAPNLTPTGRLYWTTDPSTPGRTYPYAVEDWPCIDLAGSVAASHRYRGGARDLKEWRLIRLAEPNRLKAECFGIYPDGWTGPSSSYFHFAASPPQWLRVVISRKDWGGATGTSPVHVLYGTLTADAQRHEPMLGKIRRRFDLTIGSSQAKTVWIRTTRAPYAVNVVVDKTFVPRDIDPRLSDPRQLGAEVSYELFSRRR